MDELIGLVAENCPDFESLKIDVTSHISDDAWKNLISKCKYLREIVLDEMFSFENRLRLRALSKELELVCILG